MNRRDFLKSAAAAMAIAVIPWPKTPAVVGITTKCGRDVCTTVKTITYDRYTQVNEYLAMHRHAPGVFYEQLHTFPTINVWAGDSIEFTVNWRCV